MGPYVLLCLLAMTKALAANVDISSHLVDLPQHMVAFTCDVLDKHVMYRSDNQWLNHPHSRVGCLDKPRDILQLCKEVYPKNDVRNIMPIEKVAIPSFADARCKDGKCDIQAYQCLIGEFQSAALLVPEGCEFKHDNNPCASYVYWKDHALSHCTRDDKTLNGFSMLIPCDIGQYEGVEFVCCQKNRKKATATQESDAMELPIPTEAGSKNINLVDEDIEKDMDAYTAYLQGNDKFLDRFGNEHKKYIAAIDSMERHQHDRVSKMMAEWEESRRHIQKMKETDSKGAMDLEAETMKRFQLLLSGYEQADIAERKQLNAVHLQHVQAKFNKLKREFLEKYMTELQKQPANLHKIYKNLRDYIKVEERDRQHTLNHFTHVRDHDLIDAQRIQPQSLDHLNVLDERIQQALDMLHHFPEIEKDVKPKIDAFKRQYDNIALTAKQIVGHPIEVPKQQQQQQTPKMPQNINIDWGSQLDEDLKDSTDGTEEKATSSEENATEIKVIPLDSRNRVISEDSNRENDGMYKNDETEEDESRLFINNHMDNGHGLQQASVVRHSSAHASAATGSVFGIAIGSVAVFVIIVVAVVMLKKHSNRRPITHGFVEVDPAASPEERHVSNMQLNGYENPTYQYFELNGNQKKV